MTQEFNQVNGLDLICRAHQVAMDGYQYFFDEALCTVCRFGVGLELGVVCS